MPGGREALTASFDTSLGRWDLETGEVLGWLEGHDAAVNAVVALGEGRAVSGGDDFTVIHWDVSSGMALHRFEGHRGKVVALATHSGRRLAASASWDGTVGIWDLESGQGMGFLDAGSPVNDVTFLSGGEELLSAGQDGTVRRWNVSRGELVRVEHQNGFGVTRIMIDEEGGWIIFGAVNGQVGVLDLATSRKIADLTLDDAPIQALARSSDGAPVAIGDGQGYVHVVASDGWETKRGFRAVFGSPVWAMDFTKDGRQLITGSARDEAEVWPLDAVSLTPARGGREPSGSQVEMSNGELQFAKRCSVCHTLQGEPRRRAGPTLYGVFGRKVGGLDGYAYSDTLAEAEFIWSEETINQLFDIGPEIYVPGTKMPAQRIASDADRIDLIEFLRHATAVVAKGSDP